MRGNGISYWISWILLGANDGNCWQMVDVLWHLKWFEDVWKCLNRFCIILLTGNSHVFILGFCMFDLQCRIPNITWRLTGWPLGSWAATALAATDWQQFQRQSPVAMALGHQGLLGLWGLWRLQRPSRCLTKVPTLRPWFQDMSK